MSKSRMNRVKALKDRAEWLKIRIDEQVDRGRSRSTGFDRAEMGAILWALPILEAHIEANRILQEQLREEKAAREQDFGYE